MNLSTILRLPCPYHLVLGAGKKKSLAILHGLMGYKRNWYSLATQLTKRHPDLSVVLVDLRNHGDSPKNLPGPHSIHACAADVRSTIDWIGGVDIICGHSFGGKVAMLAADQLRHSAMPPAQTWLLDTYPTKADDPNNREAALKGSFQNSDVETVVASLEKISLPIPSREALKTTLHTLGFTPTLSSWLTTNIRSVEGGFEWKFHLPAMREMYKSYMGTSIMDLLAEPPTSVRFVQAEKESRWTPTMVDKLHGVAAKSSKRTSIHVLAKAGHWVHFDNPEGLLALMDTFIAETHAHK